MKGPVALNTRTKSLKVGENEISLLPLEYKVFEYMIRHPGELITTQTLLNQVWHSDDDPSVDAVYACISRMRKKIKHNGNELIKTIRGAGYQFVPPES